MILPESIIKSIENSGILIQQEVAGQLLFLKYDKHKFSGNYSHIKEGKSYKVEFEVESFYWKQGGKYITNAVLISIT